MNIMDSISNNSKSITVSAPFTIIATGSIIEPLDTFFGVSLIVCVIWGCPGNLSALRHFYKEKDQAMSYLFVWATATDFLVCFMCLFAALPYFSGREMLVYGDLVMCNITGVVWSVASRMSVLLVVILSSARVLYSALPLWIRAHRKIGMGTLKLAVYLALVMNLVKASVLPYYNNTSYSFNPNLGMCDFDYDDVFYGGSTLYALDFVLPVIPIGLGSMVTVRSLFKRTRSRTSLSASARARRAEDVTILVFAVNYVLWNIPVGLAYSYSLLAEFNRTKYPLFNSPLARLYMIPAGLVLSAALNSALNPVIYFTRYPDMHLCSSCNCQCDTDPVTPAPPHRPRHTSHVTQAWCRDTQAPRGAARLSPTGA